MKLLVRLHGKYADCCHGSGGYGRGTRVYVMRGERRILLVWGKWPCPQYSYYVATSVYYTVGHSNQPSHVGSPVMSVRPRI